MKNFAVLSALSALLVLSGCNHDVKSLSKKISKTLGVPVNVTANNNDACLRRQLEKFYSDYKSMSRMEQTQFKLDFSLKYDQVLLAPSQQKLAIGGEYTQLLALERVCDTRSCYPRTRARKIIDDKRTYDGDKSPSTKLDRIDGTVPGKQMLSVTAASFKNEAVKRRYATYSHDLYKRVENTTTDTFIKARQRGSIFLIGEDTDVTSGCGKVVNLLDVL